MIYVHFIQEQRILSGREMLSLHGMSLKRHIDGCSDKLLGNMAGNSFSVSSFLLAVIAMFVAAALPHVNKIKPHVVIIAVQCHWCGVI